MTFTPTPQAAPAALPLLLSPGLALGALLAGSGCTPFASELDGEEDPAGMMTLGLDPADFSCVARDAGNPVMNPNGPPLDFRVPIRDYITGTVPVNLRVRACYRPDVACMRPATDWRTPDDSSIVTLPLNEGFSGYLEMEADNEVSTLYVIPAPLTPELAQKLEGQTISLLAPAALQAFGATAMLDLSPENGVISINTHDCAGPAAAGVRLELNAAAVPFTFVDGLPIPFQDITTEDGAAGFANVAPGLLVVRGYRADTAELVGLETVLVRAGWVTVTALMPEYAGVP